MDGKRYRIQGANTLSLPAEDAEKLLALGDGECALLYLYILRSGGVLDTAAAARALSRTGEQDRRCRRAGSPGRAFSPPGMPLCRDRTSCPVLPHGGYTAPQRR